MQPIGDWHSSSELYHWQGSDEENDGLVWNARGPQKLRNFLAKAESSLGCVSGCISPGREEEEGEEEEEQWDLWRDFPEGQERHRLVEDFRR